MYYWKTIKVELNVLTPENWEKYSEESKGHYIARMIANHNCVRFFKTIGGKTNDKNVCANSSGGKGNKSG